MTTVRSPHHVGGKTLIPISPGLRPTAVFGGPNGEYRYTLSRTWDDTLPALLVVMMNPSVADKWHDDPSVYKCRRYAMAWGFGSLWVGNSCAYRATDKKRLLTVADPVGPENDKYLLEMAERAAMIVFAYGLPDKPLRDRGPHVAMLLSRGGTRPLHVLKLCKDGTPSHPLYLKGDLKPTLWIAGTATSK